MHSAVTIKHCTHDNSGKQNKIETKEIEEHHSAGNYYIEFTDILVLVLQDV